MYYAYKSTTPLHMIQIFHKLAIKDINGPKLRCNVNLSSIKLDELEILLPAIQCIKNYPKNVFSLSDFTNTPLTKSRTHLSQTDSEEMEDNILNSIAYRLWDSTCASAGHLDNLFSESIMNTDFSTSHNVITRDALIQLWEESCSEADNLGVEAPKELEKHLILFRQYCNGKKREILTTSKENCQVNIPMTQWRYTGRADRVFNTHHM
jgi:hypothetical protein